MFCFLFPQLPHGCRSCNRINNSAKRTLVIIVPSAKGMMVRENIIGRKNRLQWARDTTARLATCIVITLASFGKSSIVSLERIVKLISLCTSDVWLMQAQIESTDLRLFDMVDNPRSSPKLLEANEAICVRNLKPDRILDPMGLELV